MKTPQASLIDKAVLEYGVPVVTFDSDAANSKRFAYVGTDNLKFGRELAHVLLQLNPDGGKYGIIAGNDDPNLVARVQGIREGLQRSGWTEVSESPTNCEGNITLSLEQMEYLVETNPDIGAIVPIGGWPMYDPVGWEAFVAKHPQITTVCGDALQVQLELMNRGSADGLVGQLPFQMGEWSIEFLYQKVVLGEERCSQPWWYLSNQCFECLADSPELATALQRHELCRKFEDPGICPLWTYYGVRDCLFSVDDSLSFSSFGRVFSAGLFGNDLLWNSRHGLDHYSNECG